MKMTKQPIGLLALRRRRADRIFDAIYLDGESVEDHEGWEFTESSSERKPSAWKKKVYLRGEDVLADTKPAMFKIVFEANSAEPVGASLGGKSLTLP